MNHSFTLPIGRAIMSGGVWYVKDVGSFDGICPENTGNVMVIGGSQIYDTFMADDRTDNVFLTVVDHPGPLPGQDTYFPVIPERFLLQGNITVDVARALLSWKHTGEKAKALLMSCSNKGEPLSFVEEKGHKLSFLWYARIK